MIHEESCQSRVKTIPGDLLPSTDIDTKGSNGKETEETKTKSSGANAGSGAQATAPARPQTLQIDAPLITPEQLFDF